MGESSLILMSWEVQTPITSTLVVYSAVHINTAIDNLLYVSTHKVTLVFLTTVLLNKFLLVQFKCPPALMQTAWVLTFCSCTLQSSINFHPVSSSPLAFLGGCAWPSLSLRNEENLSTLQSAFSIKQLGLS